MIKRFKHWWINHNLPFVTNKRNEDRFVLAYMASVDSVNKMVTCSAVNPVIHSLKELRKNTWDVERVDHAIEWLEDNFEVK